MYYDPKATQKRYELFFAVAYYVPALLGDRAYRAKVAQSQHAGEVLNLCRAVVAMSAWAGIVTDVVDDCDAYINEVRLANPVVFEGVEPFGPNAVPS